MDTAIIDLSTFVGRQTSEKIIIQRRKYRNQHQQHFLLGAYYPLSILPLLSLVSSHFTKQVCPPHYDDDITAAVIRHRRGSLFADISCSEEHEQLAFEDVTTDLMTKGLSLETDEQ